MALSCSPVEQARCSLALLSKIVARECLGTASIPHPRFHYDFLLTAAPYLGDEKKGASLFKVRLVVDLIASRIHCTPQSQLAESPPDKMRAMPYPRRR